MKRKNNIIAKKTSANKKNYDNLKLLFTHADFNDRVKEIREKLNIPIGGFPRDLKDSDKLAREWFWNETVCKSDEMIKNNFPDDQLPVNYFSRQIKSLIKEFNVPVTFGDAIRNYIVRNEEGLIILPTFSELTFNFESPKKSVILEFNRKLTDSDLKEIKHYVNEVSGKDLPNFNPIKDIDLKLATEEGYKNRKWFDYADQKEYKSSAKEIVENIKENTGKKIKPKDVYEHKRELEELRKKRFGKK